VNGGDRRRGRIAEPDHRDYVAGVTEGFAVLGGWLIFGGMLAVLAVVLARPGGDR